MYQKEEAGLVLRLISLVLPYGIANIRTLTETICTVTKARNYYAGQWKR